MALVITGDRISAVGTMDEISTREMPKLLTMRIQRIVPWAYRCTCTWSVRNRRFNSPTELETNPRSSHGCNHHQSSSRASMVSRSRREATCWNAFGTPTFSTGEIIYGAKAPGIYARIDSYDDALAHVRRIKAQGGISVKNYNQPRREQRQMVAHGAAAAGEHASGEKGVHFLAWIRI